MELDGSIRGMRRQREERSNKAQAWGIRCERREKRRNHKRDRFGESGEEGGHARSKEVLEVVSPGRESD